ncbi:hypothetical protein PR202_ga03845 [Eleusine coracana subsp. coracana]|uniref:Protein kinase domain-containing protein n=1 Tax=Eleusine coracana subsp. coracana TaxID=191504 RepID=A0AAV5BQ24_ELECO|nr:hypothetical protein PR202_ga03845 [Eleusine coracana subsp. coracana]
MSKRTSHNQRLQPSEDAMAQNSIGHVTAMNTSAIELISAKRDDWKITTFQALDFEAAAIPQGLIEENLIGRGGSGRVYHVAYTNRHNGSTGVVAVKQIWSSRRLDEKLEREFESEVNILGNVRHKNIVKLLCCISNAESKLLVYDYMDNVTLDNWFHGHTLCTTVHRALHGEVVVHAVHAAGLANETQSGCWRRAIRAVLHAS